MLHAIKQCRTVQDTPQATRRDYGHIMRHAWWPAVCSELAGPTCISWHVCRVILKALTAPRPWTRYAVVYKRLMNWTLPLLLPARWVDKAMADTFELNPHKLRLPSGAASDSAHATQRVLSS